MTRPALCSVICLTLSLACCCANAPAEDFRVYELGQIPNDSRLVEPKDLNGHFPFQVPASKAEWQARAESVPRRHTDLKRLQLDRLVQSHNNSGDGDADFQ